MSRRSWSRLTVVPNMSLGRLSQAAALPAVWTLAPRHASSVRPVALLAVRWWVVCGGRAAHAVLLSLPVVRGSVSSTWPDWRRSRARDLAADAELGRALAGADSVRSPDGTALDEPVDSWERGPLAALRRELHRTTKGA